MKQYLFGSPENPTALAECTHSDLINILNENQDEAILFGEVGSMPEISMLEEAIAEFPRQPYAALVVLQTDDVEYLNLWDGESDLLSALVDNPFHHGAVIFSRARLLALPEQKQTGNALWWSFVQLVLQDAPFGVMMSHQETGPKPWPLPALAPRVPRREMHWLASIIQEAPLNSLVAGYQNEIDAEAVRAGLLQLHDFLDESHRVSQAYEGEGLHGACDYWHGIMHRREPDVSNSKYWFRRVGTHPQFPELAKRSAFLIEHSGLDTDWADHICGGGNWDPGAFIDFCAECRDSQDPELTLLAEQIQLLEMRILMRYSLMDARS